MAESPITRKVVTMDPWVALLCEQLGVPVDDVDAGTIVDLATYAGQQVEPSAAPVAAFVAGYAAALRGGGAAAVTASVTAIGGLARDWTDGPDTAEPTLR